MKIDNPFDRALEVRNIQEPMRGAAADVTDTLELAWDAARSVFETRARPEHAIALTEMMLRLAGKLPSD